MDGVTFKQVDQYALCCVENFSDELKLALRENLTRICHGADQASKDRAIYKYPATIKHFWNERYSRKPWETRIGMLGELLSHVIILKLFPNFDVVSPFFNMEEKSIRKGFDLLLYEASTNNIWITEVKSGGRGADKTSCSATSALLRLARDDLKKRLAEPELNHWYNAINAAKNAIHNKASYRDSVIEILELEADLAEEDGGTASDNNVFLISALFSDVTQAIAENTVSKFTTKLVADAVFKTVWVLSLHKGTMEKLEEFLRQEAGGRRRDSGMEELTIRKLGNTKFKDLYFQLLKGDELGNTEIVKLLAIAVLLLNHKTPEIRRLGYRIILFYGNASGQYQALYDVALNSGLHPVSAVISSYFSEDDYRSESFIRNIVGSYVDTFRDQGIVLTEQQDALRTFVQSEYRKSSVVVAPTSYGKSELIIQSVKENPKQRILILVPSKALLAQTKKRLIYADIEGLGKVVTHPEMYSVERNNRAFVLTQERLNRLLNENTGLSFDMVFVDEAHNLLQSDRRNELLAAMLCILGARNPETSFKFLTPFLCDELNVRVRFLDMIPSGFKIDEYIKSERFYIKDFRAGKGPTKLKLYDHFLNGWMEFDRKYTNCFELIKGEALSKNIVYGNKKKSIESFAVELAAVLPPVDCPLIQTACEELEELFDRRYKLIGCLRKGVMYHHGSIPDTIRLYLENLFSCSKQMKFLVCNATLLEGVNLPIERLFVFDFFKGKKKLTPSQFKNLVGRVNRFSEVFAPSAEATLRKLESSIYLLGVNGYTRDNAALEGFYDKSVNVSKVVKDTVSNVLLEATKIIDGKVSDLYDDAVARLENLHPGVVQDRECRYVTTQVGKLLIANSVSEIDVFSEEEAIERKIKRGIEANGVIKTVDRLMLAISKSFIEHFDKSREYSDLVRLNQEAARNFYAMILDWKLKKHSVKQTIRLTLAYWKKLVETSHSDHVFVGKWGDTKYRDSNYENWVRISQKDDSERINLAIVRLKDEDDFFDNKIFKFVEVLNGVGALDPGFYKLIKYGTADDTKIKLIRDGYSHGLVDLMLERYPETVRATLGGEIEVSPRLVNMMIKNEESDLLIFEARMNLKPN